MSATTTHRFRRPRLRDPRVIVGAILVLASVLGTWTIVNRAAHTIHVWAAATTLVPGSTIAEGDLTSAEVNMPAYAGAYLSADDAAPIGSTVLRTVRSGELLPASEVGSVRQLAGRVLSLTLSTALPEAVAKGGQVDVWAADGRADDVKPRQILDGVDVIKADHEARGFGATQGARIEVFVPNDKLSAVLVAQTSGFDIAVVAVPERGGRK